MDTTRYIENRTKLPQAELEKCLGTWVAFSCDGRRVVASAPDLDRLEDALASLGQDPEQVVLESRDGTEHEVSLGGGERS